jgi:hypothetical protein
VLMVYLVQIFHVMIGTNRDRKGYTSLQTVRVNTHIGNALEANGIDARKV